MSQPKVTLIGGPTALIEIGGFRLLTDPTFDGPGEYRLPHVTLKKVSSPALAAQEVGPIDAVLLSHDQHSDNLDNSGRAFLNEAARVITTVAGAKRLGGRSEGLLPWETRLLTKPDGRTLQVTATPARHGPAGIEPLSGDVIGFVLTFEDQDIRPIYITAIPSGTMASPRSRAVSGPASCCCSRARRARAGRSISPWTPMTRSRRHMPSPTPRSFPSTMRDGRTSRRAGMISKNPSMRSDSDHG